MPSVVEGCLEGTGGDGRAASLAAYHRRQQCFAVAMAPFTVVKFSSEDCGTCHRMGHYDAKVAEELGLAFVSVMLQDTDTYRRYRRVLLAQYPTKEGMGWPTYLLVSAPEEPDFVIHGELKGGMAKGDFRERLLALVPQE